MPRERSIRFLPVLKTLDPGAVEEVLRKEPKLAGLLDRHPNGMESVWKMGGTGAVTYVRSDHSGAERAMQPQAMAVLNQQLGEVARFAKSDPRRSLEIGEASSSAFVKLVAAGGVSVGVISRKDPAEKALMACWRPVAGADYRERGAFTGDCMGEGSGGGQDTRRLR